MVKMTILLGSEVAIVDKKNDDDRWEPFYICVDSNIIAEHQKDHSTITSISIQMKNDAHLLSLLSLSIMATHGL